MHLPRVVQVVAASLGVRQLGSMLPSTYCSPTCPSCRTNVAAFNVATSCVSNSSFITDCGACQQCIITYAIEEDEFDTSGALEGIMQEVLDLCLNTTVSTDIMALQSQASRLSMVGDYITSKAGATTTSSLSPTNTSTPTPPAIPTANTGGPASITPAPVAPSPSPVPTATPQVTATGQSLNKSWVIGPILGSILGIVTVAVVIYFTRRKHRKDEEAMVAEKTAQIKDSDEDDSGYSTQGAPQLHSESVIPKELETNEVYELAAVEPVGSELSTPKDGTFDPIEEWPLPITPLRAMFAMTEIRDERAGNNASPKHETYYHS